MLWLEITAREEEMSDVHSHAYTSIQIYLQLVEINVLVGFQLMASKIYIYEYH